MTGKDFFHTQVNAKLQKIIKDERKRQQDHIELIASENYVSPAVLKLTGSIFTNKYAEGLPGRRYYSGCEVIDQSETIAIDLIKELFACHCNNANCKKANAHANVQPHSGSQANFAAYNALLKPGDTILGMELASGGHLTHGHKVNFSGQLYNAIAYGVNPQTGEIDYEQVRTLALKHKPKLIICGASAYSLIIDWAKFRKIADEIGAYLMADVAHIAGLIVAGVHPNPVCDVDVVTLTTHKTLRGPRGAVILCKQALSTEIDKAVFPGAQGGPLEHAILAKAQAFYEAKQPSFIAYQKNVIENAKCMVQVFKNHGFQIVGGRTDNHLFTVNTKASYVKLTGKEAAERLQKIFIIANKNTVPNDTETPFITSGVRFGTAAMTTRGFTSADFRILTHLIISVWTADKDTFEANLYLYCEQVQNLIHNLPFYDFTT